MSSSASPKLVDHAPRHVGSALAAVVLVLGLALPAAATAADEAAFDRTIRELGAFCSRGPAATCAERFFALVDADADGIADKTEIAALDQRLRVWTAANGDRLQPLDLRAMQVGFLLVDTIGIENGMLLYDEDGDGGLSLAEASADLNLDGRPLPELVQSQELVDWPSLRRRFGATAMLFDYLDIR
jgi:hypothetical protein